MNQSGTDSGQSMEDILASIRRIIAEGEQDAKDGPGAAPAPASEAAKASPKTEVAKAEVPKAEVFELTQIVQDDGSIVNVGDVAPELMRTSMEAEVRIEPAPAAAKPVAQAAPLAASEAPVAAPPPEQPAAPAPAAVPKPAAAEVAPPPVAPADTKVETAMAALSRLMDLSRTSPPEVSADALPERSDSSLTVEELVCDAVRPLLRQWLDTNLPPLVERLVREAVDRLAKRAG